MKSVIMLFILVHSMSLFAGPPQENCTYKTSNDSTRYFRPYLEKYGFSYDPNSKFEVSFKSSDKRIFGNYIMEQTQLVISDMDQKNIAKILIKHPRYEDKYISSPSWSVGHRLAKRNCIITSGSIEDSSTQMEVTYSWNLKPLTNKDRREVEVLYVGDL